MMVQKSTVILMAVKDVKVDLKTKVFSCVGVNDGNVYYCAIDEWFIEIIDGHKYLVKRSTK